MTVMRRIGCQQKTCTLLTTVMINRPPLTGHEALYTSLFLADDHGPQSSQSSLRPAIPTEVTIRRCDTEFPLYFVFRGRLIKNAL